MNIQSVRAAAMQTLLDCGISRLPVDVDAVCRKLGIRVLSYDVGAEVIERAHLYRAVRDTNGLAFYLKDIPVALFNERQELPQIMFTVGHEVGHIILQHVKPTSGLTPAHQGTDWNATPKETAANQFAALLLAPPYVLWSMGVCRTEEIMRLCEVPRQAAAYIARCITWITRRKVFLFDPMEQAVYRQFQTYIKGRGHEIPGRLMALPGQDLRHTAPLEV